MMAAANARYEVFEYLFHSLLECSNEDLFLGHREVGYTHESPITSDDGNQDIYITPLFCYLTS